LRPVARLLTLDGEHIIDVVFGEDGSEGSEGMDELIHSIEHFQRIGDLVEERNGEIDALEEKLDKAEWERKQLQEQVKKLMANANPVGRMKLPNGALLTYREEADCWKEEWEKQNNRAGEMNMEIERGWKEWAEKEANRKGGGVDSGRREEVPSQGEGAAG